MVTICLVLSVVNPKTGDFENKAVVNNKQKIVEFVREYKRFPICVEGFRINKIPSTTYFMNEFSPKEVKYIEEIKEMVERIKNGHD